MTEKLEEGFALQEPTLGMLEDQTPGYNEKSLEELPGIKEGILDDLENLRFLRRVLNIQEEGMKQQLADVEARIAALTAPAQVKDGYDPQVFNGTTEPACPDCTLDDG